MIIYLEIEVEKQAGKFVSKEEIADALIEALGDEVEVEESSYSVSASQYYPPKKGA